MTLDVEHMSEYDLLLEEEMQNTSAPEPDDSVHISMGVYQADEEAGCVGGRAKS